MNNKIVLSLIFGIALLFTALSPDTAHSYSVGGGLVVGPAGPTSLQTACEGEKCFADPSGGSSSMSLWIPFHGYATTTLFDDIYVAWATSSNYFTFTQSTRLMQGFTDGGTRTWSLGPGDSILQMYATDTGTNTVLLDGDSIRFTLLKDSVSLFDYDSAFYRFAMDSAGATNVFEFLAASPTLNIYSLAGDTYFQAAVEDGLTQFLAPGEIPIVTIVHVNNFGFPVGFYLDYDTGETAFGVDLEDHLITLGDDSGKTSFKFDAEQRTFDIVDEVTGGIAVIRMQGDIASSTFTLSGGTTAGIEFKTVDAGDLNTFKMFDGAAVSMQLSTSGVAGSNFFTEDIDFNGTITATNGATFGNAVTNTGDTTLGNDTVDTVTISGPLYSAASATNVRSLFNGTVKGGGNDPVRGATGPYIFDKFALNAELFYNIHVPPTYTGGDVIFSANLMQSVASTGDESQWRLIYTCMPNGGVPGDSTTMDSGDMVENGTQWNISDIDFHVPAANVSADGECNFQLLRIVITDGLEVTDPYILHADFQYQDRRLQKAP